MINTMKMLLGFTGSLSVASFLYVIARNNSKKENNKTPLFLAKTLYWSSASLTSVASLYGLKMFIDANWNSKTRKTTDFYIAFSWQLIRAITSCIQIYLHPFVLSKFRIGNGENLNKIDKIADKLLKDPKRFGKIVNKCNVRILIFMFMSSTYCFGSYYSQFEKNGDGLISTLPNIYIEIFNMSLWSYVLLYRSIYSNNDLHNSYNAYNKS
eukprot:109315_1